MGSLGLGTAAALALACSGQAAPVGQGGQCELASDCANGLICAPQPNGTSICTSNLGSIQELPPTPDGGAALPVGDANVNEDVQIPTSVPEASAGD